MNLRSGFCIFAAAIFVLSLTLSVYFTKAFITTLLIGVFMVYILDPVYLYLLGFIKNKPLSALITVFVASAVILYLLFFAASKLISELSGVVSPGMVSNYLAEPKLSQAITSFIARYFPDAVVSLLDGVPSTVSSYLADFLKTLISAFVSNLPVYIAQLILLVFFTYYFFIDGKDIIKKFIELSPEKEVVNHFFNELNLIYNIFFRIHFLIAVIDGIIGAIGFYIMGIPFPITWGIVLGIFQSHPGAWPFGSFYTYLPLLSDHSRLRQSIRGIYLRRDRSCPST